ncbi:MAG: EpsG family protein [Methylophilaceae bacterium]|nr:EpsG family protein [Methylophilaceae bacterium]
MLQTILIYFTFLLGMFTSVSSSKKLFLLFMTLLWIIASIRVGQGPDYYGYYHAYLILDSNPIDELSNPIAYQELLFRLLGSSIKAFGLEYQSFLSLIAAISLYYIGKIAWRYSAFPILTALLFFSMFYFTWPYSGIRQGLILCIGAYYFMYCAHNNKFILFILISFALSLIHLSAIFFIFFFIVYKMHLSKKMIIFLSIIIIFLSFYFQHEIVQFINFLPYNERVFFYSQSFYTTSYFDFKTFSRLIIFIILLFIYNEVRKKDDLVLSGVCSISIASFPLYAMFKFSEILASQASLYGFIFIILVLPNYLNRGHNSKLKIFKLLFILLFSTMFFYKTYTYTIITSEKNAENIKLIDDVYKAYDDF